MANDGKDSIFSTLPANSQAATPFSILSSNPQAPGLSDLSSNLAPTFDPLSSNPQAPGPASSQLLHLSNSQAPNQTANPFSGGGIQIPNPFSGTELTGSNHNLSFSIEVRCQKCIDLQKEKQNILELLTTSEKKVDALTRRLEEVEEELSELHDALDQRCLADALEEVLKSSYEAKFSKVFRNFHVVSQQQLEPNERVFVDDMRYLIDAWKETGNLHAHCARLNGNVLAEVQEFGIAILEDRYLADTTKELLRTQFLDAKFLISIVNAVEAEKEATRATAVKRREARNKHVNRR